MTASINESRVDAARRRARPRSGRRPSRCLAQWSSGAVLLVGIAVGVSPQIAGAQTPPTPPTVTPSTVQTPGPCAVEVIIDVGSLPPTSTLPGTCQLSAASGVFTEPQVADASGDALPATGSSTGATAAVASIVLMAGAILWLVARRPRAS